MKTGILSFGIGSLLLTNLLSVPAYAATKLTTSQHRLLASSDDCIEAHDACLLAISPNRPNSPVKQYIIEQDCGDKLYLDLQLGLAE